MSEEIKDIERSIIAGIHSHILVINIAKRKANKEEKEVNLYSELDLPIEITHILVKAGIRTCYDLLLKSIEEISNIPGMTKSKLKIIMKELETEVTDACKNKNDTITFIIGSFYTYTLITKLLSKY